MVYLQLVKVSLYVGMSGENYKKRFDECTYYVYLIFKYEIMLHIFYLLKMLVLDTHLYQ